MKENEDSFSIAETIAIHSPDLTDLEFQKQVEVIEKLLLEGKPLGESLNLTPDAIEFIYREGHRLYMMKKYADAVRYFQLLYMLAPLDARFSFGVAASHHMLHDYEQAVIWYLTLSLVDKDSPLPYYYLSDCAEKQQDPASALFYLEKAVGKCGNQLVFAELKQRVLRMIEHSKEKVR